jgi:hypothetical protein
LNQAGGAGVSESEDLKESLHDVCIEIENLAIENLVYFLAIAQGQVISLSEVERRVADALADPKKRAEVREMYSEIWRVLERIGHRSSVNEMRDDGLMRVSWPN